MRSVVETSHIEYYIDRIRLSTLEAKICEEIFEASLNGGAFVLLVAIASPICGEVIEEMARTGFVYALCEPDGVTIRYIGKTINMRQRLHGHLSRSELKRKTRKNSWIKALLARGERPKMNLIEEVTDETCLNEREVFWIAFYRFVGVNLTNETAGGDGWSPTPDSVEKLRRSLTGRKFSAETCARISAVQKGKVVSEDARRKMSAAHKGNKYAAGAVRSPETRAKLAEAQRGRKPSQATLAKLRGNKHAQGLTRSAETRAKISASRKGHKISEETRAKMRVAARRREEHRRLKRVTAGAS